MTTATRIATVAPESAIGGAAGWRVRAYDPQAREYRFRPGDPIYATRREAQAEADRINASTEETR